MQFLCYCDIILHSISELCEKESIVLKFLSIFMAVNIQHMKCNMYACFFAAFSVVVTIFYLILESRLIDDILLGCFIGTRPVISLSSASEATSTDMGLYGLYGKYAYKSYESTGSKLYGGNKTNHNKTACNIMWYTVYLNSITMTS